MRLSARPLSACCCVATPASAQLENVGNAVVSDVGVARGAAALPARRRHPAQLRLEAGDRRVQARAEAAAGLRARLLGRDALLQPPAEGRAGRQEPARGAGAARARPRPRGSPRRRRRERRASSRRSRTLWGEGRLARPPRRLHARHGAAPQAVPQRRRSEDVLRAVAAERRARARRQHVPLRDEGRRAGDRRRSSATRTIRAPRTTSSTPSTIRCTRRWRSRPRASTRRSSRRCRTPSTCRRTSSSSTGCGTRWRIRTCARSTSPRICGSPATCPATCRTRATGASTASCSSATTPARASASALFEEMADHHEASARASSVARAGEGALHHRDRGVEGAAGGRRTRRTRRSRQRHERGAAPATWRPPRTMLALLAAKAPAPATAAARRRARRPRRRAAPAPAARRRRWRARRRQVGAHHAPRAGGAHRPRPRARRIRRSRCCKEAVQIEESMRPPNGAADPVKPSHELLGEVLLRAGKPADAAAAFDACLLRMPNRARSLIGAARAHAAAGNSETRGRAVQDAEELLEGKGAVGARRRRRRPSGSRLRLHPGCGPRDLVMRRHPAPSPCRLRRLWLAALCGLLASPAAAQQPFVVDDAGITQVGTVHIELSDQVDGLRPSARPTRWQTSSRWR